VLPSAVADGRGIASVSSCAAILNLGLSVSFVVPDLVASLLGVAALDDGYAAEADIASYDLFRETNARA
jgi:hypothetical protein